MAYWLLAPGSVAPHGYSRCWSPPAAAYSHSASLGRNPPSQMQNAYASYQFTHAMGRFSCGPATGVHVDHVSNPLSGVHARLTSLGATLTSSDATQPSSKV